MKKGALVGLLALGLLVLGAEPSDGWHRWHGGVFIDVGPIWLYPPPPAYVAPPPTIVVQPPPVYVQAPAPPPALPEHYWHYCPSARAYYPTVPACPEPWVKVPPRPPL